MRDHPNALMLFAAGFGTRMGDLTANTPKPLIEVAGKPLIDHTLDLASAVQPLNMVANLHYRAEQIETHLASKPVTFSYEQPKILDTGGGLRKALPLLGDDPVFTSNSDAIWSGPNPFTFIQKAWDPEKMDALLLCVPLAQCHGRTGLGDFAISETGHISRGTEVVYGGIQILKTQGLFDIRETSFSLNVLWDRMIEGNRLFGAIYPGQWCDVGTPGGIKLAEELINSDV